MFNNVAKLRFFFETTKKITRNLQITTKSTVNYKLLTVNYKLLFLGSPIPHNMAKTFDGPPTLERSGSDHRAGRFPSSRLRREERDERWSLL